MRFVAAVLFAVTALISRAEWVAEVVTNRVEYDAVEYLQMNSGYIKLDYYADDKMSLRFDAMPLGVTGGSFVGSDSYHFRLFNYSSQIYWDNPYNNGQGRMNGSSWPANERAVIDAGMGWVDKNGTRVLTKSGITWTTPTDVVKINGFTAGLRVYLCTIYVNGTTGPSGQHGTICTDLIPVAANGVGYMYDRVTGRTFANSGTGLFTYGAVTGKVEYVSITTNHIYRSPSPMRAFDASNAFNINRTQLGGTGNGGDGTILRPTARIAIKKNEED